MPRRPARVTPRLFIYRSAPSASALALAAALRDVGVPAKRISNAPRLTIPGDAFVGWGDYYQLGRPAKSLNWCPPAGKLSEMQTLDAAGVTTPRFTSVPPADPQGWLGRAFVHHSGNDLLTPPVRPGFWVQQETIVKEFRIHVWEGVSARVAMKVVSPDAADHHPWIRSHAAGWRLDYGEGARHVRQRHRDAAKSACAALHLDFGAVDIGELEDKRVIVLEVNRAPGLEGETINKYRDKIAEWWRA